jgi:glycosyltransferase involved in cell wall biosynthesis
MSRPLRIALIASARHPIREPFAGGLEGHTWTLAAELTRRGHEVALFARPGSDPALGLRQLEVARLRLSMAAQLDASMPDRDWLDVHHAYLRLMLDLADDRDRFDVVHNNSLHYLPIAMASALPMPVITTLHTPPTPWLESAMQCRTGSRVRFTAVSAHTARAWRLLVPEARVVRNGVDTRQWSPGPGGNDLVWSGRIVPEKDPETAIRAARAAGRRLRVAGPISDPRYFRARIAPLLGDGIEYAGHLRRCRWPVPATPAPAPHSTGERNSWSSSTSTAFPHLALLAATPRRRRTGRSSPARSTTCRPRLPTVTGSRTCPVWPRSRTRPDPRPRRTR